jgi:histidyl-tRNA synthetase
VQTKLDKIGQEKVEEELQTRGFSSENISNLAPLLQIKPLVQSVLNKLTECFLVLKLAQKGREELKEVWSMVKAFGLGKCQHRIRRCTV